MDVAKEPGRYQLLTGIMMERGISKIYRARDTETERVVVIKSFKKENEHCATYEQKILEHLNELLRLDPDARRLIVEMLDSFVDPKGERKSIVLEELGCDLETIFLSPSYAPFSLTLVSNLGYQLCLALQFLHKHKIVHMDLKPANILLVHPGQEKSPQCEDVQTKKKILLEVDIKLIDFGGAVLLDSLNVLPSMFTTPEYRAPEYYVTDSNLTTAYDMWATGCVLFEMYTKDMLFDLYDGLRKVHPALMEKTLGEMPRSLKEKIEEPTFKDNEWTWIEKEVHKTKPLMSYKKMEQPCEKEDQFFTLLQSMLKYEQTRRITATEALSDPFLQRQTI